MHTAHLSFCQGFEMHLCVSLLLSGFAECLYIQTTAIVTGVRIRLVKSLCVCMLGGYLKLMDSFIYLFFKGGGNGGDIPECVTTLV